MSAINAETFAFLDELADGRDKAWFDANRKRYEANLLEPMRGAVEALGPRLRAIIPDCEVRPAVNKTLTRINRDMRFAKGQSPYKDNMIALFYREGRKKEDAQLFLGLQPSGTWAGLYVPTPLLAADSPMGRAVATDPDAVVAAGTSAGLGRDLDLVACKKYGEVERPLNPRNAEDYLQGPHLCALRQHAPAEAVADADAFMNETADRLERLVPLWRLYSGA